MYDYYFKQWSTFTNHEGVGATVLDDIYYYARSDGSVYKSSPGTYLDGTVQYKLRAATGWIRLDTLQGYYKCLKAYVLGEFYTDHSLNMWCAYNYQDAYITLKTWSTSAGLNQDTWGDGLTWGYDSAGASDIWGGAGSDTVYQFRAGIPRPKVQSIKFLFENEPSETPGQGYEITELMLRVGLKESGYPLGSAKTV
jgi:hypothetical protein